MYAGLTDTLTLEPGDQVYVQGALGIVVQRFERANPDKDDHLVVAFPGGVPTSLLAFQAGGDFVDMEYGQAVSQLRLIPRVVRREKVAPSLAEIIETTPGGLQALLDAAEASPPIDPSVPQPWPWDVDLGAPWVDR